MYALNLPLDPAAEAYLAAEREAPYKSEFIQGGVVAMAGASREHNELTTNLTVSVGSRLRGANCRAYGSDMRVRAGAESYCYPDLSIVCGEPRFTDQKGDVLLNPLVIVEVLSPTTEALDRGEKFLAYQRTASVREIVFVAQHRCCVERYERQEGGLWLYEVLESPDTSLTLGSCKLNIPLDELYERVL
jgi:Uma2 family endonuclease